MLCFSQENTLGKLSEFHFEPKYDKNPKFQTPNPKHQEISKSKAQNPKQISNSKFKISFDLKNKF